MTVAHWVAALAVRWVAWKVVSLGDYLAGKLVAMLVVP